MQRIEDQGEDDAGLAREVLSWLTYARRPLSAVMLRYALAIQPQDDNFDEDALIHDETLLDVCAGLVIVDKDTNVIQFVHYTTQEYFLQTRKTILPGSPLNIVTTCLTFLLFDEATKNSMPNLYNYIADNWGHHARESPETEALVEKIVTFVQDKKRLLHCVENMTASAKTPGPSSALLSNLHLAARFDLVMTMTKLLELDASHVNAQDDEGRTPLYHAAATEDGDVVRLLLSRSDVDYDLPSYSHGTALHSAIDAKQENIAITLLLRGVDANSKDSTGQQPIHKAVKSGLSRTLEALLNGNVEVTASTHSGHTPLELAMPLDSKLRQKTASGIWRGTEVSAPTSEYTPCLKLILERVTTTDINHGGMLFEAVKDGRPDLVQLFLDKGAEVSAQSAVFNKRTALHWASEKGFERIAELLIHHGGDPGVQDARGFVPLHYAASAGHEGICKILLPKMSNLNIKGNNGLTPYQSAKLQKRGAIAQLIINAGAEEASLPSTFELRAGAIEIRHRDNLAGRFKVESQGHMRTLSGKSISGDEYKRYAERLISAASMGDTEGVLLALSKGVSVGERDHEHNKTALHWACENGHTDIAQLLVDWGTSLTCQDQYGETCLHYAAESGHTDIVEILVQRGADVAIKDDRERTPLRCARDNHQTQAVKILLKQWDDSKEEADEQDAQKKSLLHWAAEVGSLDTCRSLLQLGTRINAFQEDNRGRTPLYYASQRSEDLSSLLATAALQ
jgi:ankyrin repeat protein